MGYLNMDLLRYRLAVWLCGFRQTRKIGIALLTMEECRAMECEITQRLWELEEQRKDNDDER